MLPTLLLLAVTAQAMTQPTPAIAAATYASFMELEPGHRPPLFHRLTPWNQAILLREHMERWRQQHADRFSQEQLSAVAEYLTVVEQLVSGTRTDRDRELALKARLDGLFTPDELQQASVLTGTYIP